MGNSNSLDFPRRGQSKVIALGGNEGPHVLLSTENFLSEIADVYRR